MNNLNNNALNDEERHFINSVFNTIFINKNFKVLDNLPPKMSLIIHSALFASIVSVEKYNEEQTLDALSQMQVSGEINQFGGPKFLEILEYLFAEREMYEHAQVVKNHKEYNYG